MFYFLHKISFPSITYDKNFRASTSYPMKTNVLRIVVFHKYICLRGASSSRSRSSGDFMSTPPPPTYTPTPTPSVFWIRYEGDRLLLRRFNIFDLCWTIKHGEGGRLTRRKVFMDVTVGMSQVVVIYKSSFLQHKFRKVVETSCVLDTF